MRLLWRWLWEEECLVKVNGDREECNVSSLRRSSAASLHARSLLPRHSEIEPRCRNVKYKRALRNHPQHISTTSVCTTHTAQRSLPMVREGPEGAHALIPRTVCLAVSSLALFTGSCFERRDHASCISFPSSKLSVVCTEPDH